MDMEEGGKDGLGRDLDTQVEVALPRILTVISSKQERQDRGCGVSRD